jgi:anti-sigma factor RsiW
MGTSTCIPMSCSTRQKKLSTFADGEGSSAWRSEMETHIACCPQCRQAVADLVWLWQTLEDAAPPRTRPDFAQAVMSRITEESRSGFLNWMHVLPSMFPAPATMTAMVVFGLLIGGWMGRTVMDDTSMIATSQGQAATLAAMDAFAPTPRGSLAEGYLVLVSNVPQVKQ